MACMAWHKGNRTKAGVDTYARMQKALATDLSESHLAKTVRKGQRKGTLAGEKHRGELSSWSCGWMCVPKGVSMQHDGGTLGWELDGWIGMSRGKCA